jgi:hypothetical protein
MPLFLHAGWGILVSGCRLSAESVGIGGTGQARRGLGRLSDREVAVKDFLAPAQAPEEHIDYITGSPEPIRRATVHPDRTELSGKHRHKAARRRPALAAGVNARRSHSSAPRIR